MYTYLSTRSTCRSFPSTTLGFPHREVGCFATVKPQNVTFRQSFDTTPPVHGINAKSEQKLLEPVTKISQV